MTCLSRDARSQLGCEVHLLEVNTQLVRQARERLGEDRVSLHDGVSLWPYEDDSFDICLLLFVLHHINTVQTTLSEAARVAKKVLVLEDQPRSAPKGMVNLAVQVTAQHFRPFGQDPQVLLGKQCLQQARNRMQLGTCATFGQMQSGTSCLRWLAFNVYSRSRSLARCSIPCRTPSTSCEKYGGLQNSA